MAIQATVPINFGPDTVGAYVRISTYRIGKSRLQQQDKEGIDAINAAAAAVGSDKKALYPPGQFWAVAEIDVFPNQEEALKPNGKTYHSTWVKSIKIREPTLNLSGNIPNQLYNALKTYLIGLERAPAIKSLSDITDV